MSVFNKTSGNHKLVCSDDDMLRCCSTVLAAFPFCWFLINWDFPAGDLLVL